MAAGGADGAAGGCGCATSGLASWDGENGTALVSPDTNDPAAVTSRLAGVSERRGVWTGFRVGALLGESGCFCRHGTTHSEGFPACRGCQLRRRQERRHRWTVPLAAPQGCLRRALQGDEHEQQLGRHVGWRRDRAGAGRTGRSLRAGAGDGDEPGTAQAGQRSSQPCHPAWAAVHRGRRHRRTGTCTRC